MIIKSDIKENNIKCLIFDIDDTLVLWKRVYDFYKATFDFFGIPYKEEYNDILDKSFIEGDIISNKKGKATKEIYSYCHEKSLPILNEYGISGIEFMNKMFELEKNYADTNDDIKYALEVLSKKYLIICLTNWFVEPATSRLKQNGIYKYIKKIYGYDTIPPKPNKLSVYKILNDYNLKNNEVIIIGNSDTDLLTAINSNIKSILIDFEQKNQHLWNKSNAVITEMSDIIELLKNKEE